MPKRNYKSEAKQRFLLKEYGDLGGGGNITGYGSYVSAGIVNPGMGTYSSPDSRQNLSAFANNHPSMYYPVGQNKIDWFNSEKATAPDPKDIEALKNKVTPDEVLLGIELELHRQFHKNKSNAKLIVIKNLKKDPKYYSSLHALIGDDDGETPPQGNEGPKQMNEKIKEAIQDSINRREKRRYKF